MGLRCYGESGEGVWERRYKPARSRWWMAFYAIRRDAAPGVDGIT